MTFLQPLLLYALPLALLPVIIHLLNRLRHRTQAWGAMRFLVAASRSSVNRARLKQFLILLLRTLAVLMLILFLARPLTGGWMGWAFASAPDTVLILLDRSASMDTRLAGTSLTRREQALQRIQQAAEPYQGVSNFVLIESAGATAQSLAQIDRIADHALASSTDTTTDMPSLLQRSVQWLSDNQAGTTEIWIASDLQRSNWYPSDDRWQSTMQQFEALPQTVRFRLLAVNEQTEVDTSIQLADVALLRKQSQERSLRITADFTQSSGTGENLNAIRTINGLSSSVEIPMQGSALRWQDLWSLGSGNEQGWGSLTLAADGNLNNNALYFVFGQDRPNQALVISDQAYDGSVLALASGQATATGWQASEIRRPGPSALSNLEEVSLIIWQGPLAQDQAASTLQSFASEGGVVLCFPPSKSQEQVTPFAGVRWVESEMASTDQSFAIGRWDQETGLLSDTAEGFRLTVDQLEVIQRRRIQHTGKVIAAFADGEPLLIQQIIGQGSIYFMTTLPHPNWSGLDQGTVLLPLIQRARLQGARRLEQTYFWTCGDVSQPELEAGWLPVEEGSEKSITEQAGVYRQGDRLAAVNIPSAEFLPELASGEEIQALFKNVSMQLFEETTTRGETDLQSEVWRVFLGCMLAFLLIESWLMISGPGSTAHLAASQGGLRPQTRSAA